jgi:DNA-binding transcriptional LysR family regulator
VLVLRQGFGSREWFEAACQIARVRPRVLLESAAPHILVALARAAYGIAIVPSAVQFDRRGVRALTLLQNGTPIGGWVSVAWDPRRFLAPYAEWFVEEVVTFSRRAWPGRDVIRGAPPLPRPRV